MITKIARLKTGYNREIGYGIFRRYIYDSAVQGLDLAPFTDTAPHVVEGDLSAAVTDLPHPVFEGRHVGAECQAEIPQHEVGRCSHNGADFLVALKSLEGATGLQALYFHLARWVHGLDQLLYLWGGAGRKELDDVLGQHSSG